MASPGAASGATTPPTTPGVQPTGKRPLSPTQPPLPRPVNELKPYIEEIERKVAAGDVNGQVWSIINCFNQLSTQRPHIAIRSACEP